MAGRRYSKDPARPTHRQTRAQKIERLLASGQTPAQRAAAAFDALRMAALHSPERGEAALTDAAGYLSGLTAWIAKGDAR